jgi:hypothetical protein
MDPQYDATFHQLQRLTSEKFHELGDLLLPSIVPGLIGLKQNGLNPEGKTRKGIPDSFVGSSPRTCSVAIEYSTQDEGMASKLASDYAGIRRECPDATRIVLCVSRSTDGCSLSGPESDAAQSGIDLVVVDGRQVARSLCEFRPDLRARFLGISIDSHTFASLSAKLQNDLDTAGKGRIDPRALSGFVRRLAVERAVHEVTHRKSGRMLLVVAPAGLGKTTWSFEHAKRHAGVEAVVWMPAAGLATGQTDAISLAIVHFAYGSPDAGRVNEMADLLRQAGATLRVVIDAIDEATDYAHIARCLGSFQVSRLAPRTNVLLTCREAALPAIRATLGDQFPELFQPLGRDTNRPMGRVQLPALNHDDATALLQKSGASPHEARTVISILPRRFQGNALFLLRGLEQVQLGVPVPEEQTPIAWVNSFAVHLIADIAKRLRTNGRGLGEATIRQSLEAIALAILDSSDRTATPEQIPDLPDAGQEGEQTFVERAVQAGVLVRQNAGIGFAHALFFEYFAATALSREPDLAQCIERLSSEGNYEVLAQVVMRREKPIDALLQLLRANPIAACKVATQLERIDDSGLRQALVDAASANLDARFLTEKAGALRLLRGMRWPEARRRAVTWFNALAPSTRSLLKYEAADLFLSLEEPGAFKVIALHAELMPDWYEPAFVARFARLTRPFADALKAEARKHLSNNDASYAWARRRLTMLLALLHDDWLPTHLQQQLEHGPLDEAANRALLHLNTDAAIATYAASVEKYWEVEDEAASSKNPENASASIYDEAHMPKGMDILMHEHGVLTDLVAAALAQNDARRAAFAAEWAAFLGEEPLVAPYYAAYRRFRGRLGMMRSALVSNIIERSGAERAIRLYHAAEDDAVRHDIVACLYRAPGPESAAFLQVRLKEKEHHFSATQSLQLMGAVNAAPDIQELLRTGEPQVQSMAAQALGTLRHVPAVGDLVHGMKVGIFGCIASLGRIGTAEGYKALGQHFRIAVREREQTIILRALVQRRDPIGLNIAVDLCDEFPEARAAIATAVGYPDLRERLNEWDDIGPLLTDEPLLRHVLGSTMDALRSDLTLLDFSLRGVAVFDAAEALDLLIDVAERRLPPGLPPEAEARSGDADRYREAKRLLALRGLERYQRQVVEDELNNVRDDAPGWALQFLTVWPRAIVRQVLLERIAQGTRVRVWVELLQWFAVPADYDLFRGLEDDDDERVADVAHDCSLRLAAARNRTR